MLALLLSCARPDPDALLRAHDLDGASAAWAAIHGEALDIDHPVADILSRRAVTDPAITAATVAETMRAVRLLEAGKATGVTGLDLPVDQLAPWLGAVEALALPPLLVVAGRSDGALDKDPYQGGALPWQRGRLIGFATHGLTALGARVDEAAAPRLVTLRLQDQTGDLLLTFAPLDGIWWTTAASDARAGARLVLAGNLAVEEGTAAAVARYGKGVVGR